LLLKNHKFLAQKSLDNIIFFEMLGLLSVLDTFNSVKRPNSHIIFLHTILQYKDKETFFIQYFFPAWNASLVDFLDNPFRDKIRDIRFRDKNTFETSVSINSLSRIEISVFEVTGFFVKLAYSTAICLNRWATARPRRLPRPSDGPQTDFFWWAAKIFLFF